METKKYISLKSGIINEIFIKKGEIQTIEEWCQLLNVDKSYFLNPKKINGEYQVGDFCKTPISLFRLYEPIELFEFEDEPTLFTYRINYGTDNKIPTELLEEISNYLFRYDIEILEDKDFTYFYIFNNYQKLEDEFMDYIENTLNKNLYENLK